MNYYFVSSKGFVRCATTGGKHAEDRKNFGDYFRSKKMAEKARVRMMKLFKRLKAK